MGWVNGGIIEDFGTLVTNARAKPIPISEPTADTATESDPDVAALAIAFRSTNTGTDVAAKFYFGYFGSLVLWYFGTLVLRYCGSLVVWYFGKIFNRGCHYLLITTSTYLGGVTTY